MSGSKSHSVSSHLPFPHALQCVADPNSLAVNFSQQQFGDLHGVFSVSLLAARRKTGGLATVEMGLDAFPYRHILFPHGKSSHNV
jgi:hypothetical protein